MLFHSKVLSIFLITYNFIKNMCLLHTTILNKKWGISYNSYIILVFIAVKTDCFAQKLIVCISWYPCASSAHIYVRSTTRTYARTYDGDILLLDRTHSVLNTDTASRRHRRRRRRHIADAAVVYVARAQLEQRRL